MNKGDQIRRLVADHKKTVSEMQRKLAQINDDLKQSVQDRKRHEIRQEFAETLKDQMKQIRTYRDELAQDRKRVTNPKQSLFRAAWRAELTPAQQAVLSSVDTLSTDILMDLAGQYRNPVLTMAAWQSIEDRLDGDELTNARLELKKQADAFIPMREVQEIAGLEHLLIESQLLHNDQIEGSATDRLTLGREQAELRQYLEAE